MKKIQLILFTILFAIPVFAQHIHGDIAKSHRKMLTHYGDTIKGGTHALYTIQFGVNAKGSVTSTKIIDEVTNEPSSVDRMAAMNLVRKFKFEPGTWFPKYHQGTVKIVVVPTPE